MSTPAESVPACSLIIAMSNSCVCVQISSTARKNPKSPNLVTMNAFFAAAAAAGRSNQNPISRYEETPTSSQKMNSCNRLDASTRPSIDEVNSPMYAK